MKLYKIILEPKTGFQLTSFGSSMISRVIIRNLVTLYGPAVIDEISGSDTFAVSDLLPWSKGESKGDEDIFFLPLPKISLPQLENPNTRIIKKLKKAKFIDKNIISDFFNNTDSIVSDNSNYQINGPYITDKARKINLTQEDSINPHNVPMRERFFDDENRQTDQQFYRTKSTWLTKGGLFFYLYSPESLQDKLLSAIQLIEDTGLGKNISTGAGKFKVLSSVPEDFAGPNKEENSLLLSQWIPSQAELSAIDLVNYGLYNYRPIKPTRAYGTVLKSINYISSGSLIKGAHSSIIGTYYNIGTSESPSFAWGKAIVIPGV